MAEKIKEKSVDVVMAMRNFPYFVFRDVAGVNYKDFEMDLIDVAQNYVDYKSGATFNPEGTSGSYVPSNILFKRAAGLVNKEARFMFSQTPDIVVQSEYDDETAIKAIQQYQKVVNKVCENSHFSSKLLKSAKDCFIGKRVAILVDYSEQAGIMIRFYNALKFYYENDIDTGALKRFVCYEELNKATDTNERQILVIDYILEDGQVYVTQTIYDGVGNVEEELITMQKIELKSIPAVVITNDGVLDDTRGVSEIKDLIDIESGTTMLENADVDSLRKGMNPVRYVVDMNSQTTNNLSSGAGAFWEMKSEQNQNEVHPMVGTLAPALNHTETLKETLSRQRAAMYETIDVPDISQSGLLAGITSFKALKALYYPLTVRCNEKLMTWLPAIKSVIKTVIEYAMLNKENVQSLYVLSGLTELEYDVNIVPNYALLDDETEEKGTDLTEIAQRTRSRKSYIKKWRADEFKSDDQIDDELMQIAIEENMFDTMSMNAQVQNELNNRTTEETIDNKIEEQKVEENLK